MKQERWRNLFCTVACAIVTAASTTAMPSAQAQMAGIEDDAAVVAESEAPLYLLSTEELRAVLAPVALYPDELLAIVLPASTNPLQVVQASRFLEKKATDPALEPNPDWDPAIAALINYPEAATQMNDNLEWTEQLGNAVLDQQEDVMNTIQQLRDEAVDAGYLKSNEQQTIVQEGDTIIVQPAQPNVVYVPTYDPQPIVYQNYAAYPPPVYSTPYVPYYNPTATFFAGAVVGATFAYAFDWDDDDIDIDCCDGDFDGGDIEINNSGDINIDNDRVNIDNNRFSAETRPAKQGKMTWSPEKARQKSTTARQTTAKARPAVSGTPVTSPKPAARIQSGAAVQKQSQRGQTSLNLPKKSSSVTTKVSTQQKQLKPKQQKLPQVQKQEPAKAINQTQLKQKPGGAFGQVSSGSKVNVQSKRGANSLKASGQPRPNRR